MSFTPLGLLFAAGSLTSDVSLYHHTAIAKGTLKPSPFAMMTVNSFYAATCSLIGSKPPQRPSPRLTHLIALIFGELGPVYLAIEQNPVVFRNLIIQCSTFVLGNIFIFLAIAWIGNVYLSIVTTTRKIFSIFISILIFQHDIDRYKFIGIGLVVVGIIFEMVTGFNKKRKAAQAKKVKND